MEHDHRVTATGDDCKPSGLDTYAEFTKSRKVVDAYEAAVTARTADVPYFFHADHLGSGSMITDGSGNPYQTLAYAPFGETLIDLKNGSYDEPYKFSGKMKDEESGLYYFNARYYWDEGGIFITPDPRHDERPWESPYAICGNNPINRIDEDGEFWLQLGGAILSAAIDYAGQVAGNMATGQSLGDAMTKNISVGSLLVSATEGAINPIGGVSKAATKAVAKSVVTTVAKTTLKEAGKAAAGQVVDNAIDMVLGKDVNITDGVLTEAVVGGIVGNVKVAPNSPKANQTIKELNAKLDSGKSLTKRQTERMATAKTEKLSNDLVKGTMEYVGTSNQKAATNTINKTNE